MKLDTSPQALAEELLGRPFDQLAHDERDVLYRICSGTVTGLDADERAAANMSFGDRLADKVAAIGGSWAFIGSFGVILCTWMLINSRFLEHLGLAPFDAYPYIFLNLMLSMLAALQAPVIMMSQNRQAAKDRLDAGNDYQVNLKAEIEIMALLEKVEHLTARQEEQTELIHRLLAERPR